MGFKKTNYTIEETGIVLPEVYAQIVEASVDSNGKAYAVFSIQQSREAIKKFVPLETVAITCVIDKEKPLHEQIYIKAKEAVFEGWEDDIVEENTEVEE